MSLIIRYLIDKLNNFGVFLILTELLYLHLSFKIIFGHLCHSPCARVPQLHTCTG